MSRSRSGTGFAARARRVVYDQELPSGPAAAVLNDGADPASSDQALALIDRARAALAEARDLQAAKRIADLAQAAVVYARRVKASQDAIDHALEIRARAERLMGEYLARSVETMERRGRGRVRERLNVAQCDVCAPRLVDLGITRSQSSRAQELARMPGHVFERAVARAKGDRGTSITRSVLDARRVRRLKEIGEKARRSPKLDPDRRWPVIIADPPWTYENASGGSWVASQQYPTMKLDEIKRLEVPAADDAVLLLWVPGPLVPWGLEVVAAWDFHYKSCLVWVKDKIGPGWWAREAHELVFVASRGSFPPPGTSVRPQSVFEAPRREHSRKPDELYEIAERAWPDLPKLELFARRERDGWDRWGFEA